jgi:F0F1-type ATP synthase assembly protein I
MKLARIIVGEMLLLAASILIFRSIWTLLDQYFGTSSLWPMLIIGIVVTILGLVIINHEVECEMKEARKPRQD